MPALTPKLLTEFLGTFFLTLTISLAVTHAGASAPIAIGVMLVALVSMGGAISGAQYNPAVTLAVWLSRSMPARDVGPYLAAQFVGGLAGAGLATGLSGRHPAPYPAALANATEPGASAFTGLASAFTVELLFTFALALVVLNVACSKKTAGNPYFGVAIGLTIMAAAFVGGPISGGAYNPAVGLGLCTVDALRGGSMGHVWLYLAGPLAGGAIAAGVFRIQHSDAPV